MNEDKEQFPVWVDKNRCKGCDICVSYCPAGVLAMAEDRHTIQGIIIKVVHPESCIGCRACELSCPDFAINVASKGFKFAKLNSESKERALKIKENNFRELKEDK